MKLVVTFAFALALGFGMTAPAVAKGDDPCLTMSWSGGAAGSGIMTVNARFVELNEEMGSARIQYAHKGGELVLRIVKRKDGRMELSGLWKQEGSMGRAYLLLDKDQKAGAGYWTSGKDGTERHDLNLAVVSCPR